MEITKKQFDGFILTEEDARNIIDDTVDRLSDEILKRLVGKARDMVPFENMLREKEEPPSIEEITLMINKMMFLMGMDQALSYIMEGQKEWAKKQKIML